MACTTIDYNNIDSKITLSPTDEIILVIGGVPNKMTISSFLIAIGSQNAILPVYVDEKEAREDGMITGQRFKAARKNKMGVPGGTIIELL